MAQFNVDTRRYLIIGALVVVVAISGLVIFTRGAQDTGADADPPKTETPAPSMGASPPPTPAPSPSSPTVPSPETKN
ncbi:MAG TPA: hypothetical protein VJ890_26205 [Vineibacter sp.]|nr:hypothetical protein [Vineibacter sp.]